MGHATRHPLAGTDVMLTSEHHPVTPVHVDDWLDHMPSSLPTALATPAALQAMWDDDEDLIYGHIGSVGVIIHASEVGWVAWGQVHAPALLAVWKDA
jgi:hypothetical protein